MPLIEQNAPGFFYKVFWKREDDPRAQWKITEIPEWEQNSFIIPGQPTFKPYRVKVEAHNARGQAHTTPTEVIGYSGEDGKYMHFFTPLESFDAMQCDYSVHS